MKFAIRLLFISTLAIAPIGCNNDRATDESVSANADRTESSEQAQSNNMKERPAEQQRQTVREAPPAYRAPATRTNKPVDNRTADNRTADDRRADDRRDDRMAENRAERRDDRRAEELRAEREDRVVAADRNPRTETVPSGTKITVTLADTVSTETNSAGDSFTAHLTQPIVMNGRVVAEKGDRVTGHIAKLDEPGRVKGKARLELVLDEIRTKKETHKLSTEPFIAVSEDSHTRDAAEIGGGAAVGAAIGAITGGKKGAAVGAVIGGGTGTTAVLLTKGKQLTIDPETKVNFVLSRDLELQVIRNTNT
jgi:hypothetical protein